MVTVGPGTRVFLFSKSMRCYDMKAMLNCSCLCYSLISATKREMIRFTIVPPDVSQVFLNDFIVRLWNLRYHKERAALQTILLQNQN